MTRSPSIEDLETLASDLTAAGKVSESLMLRRNRAWVSASNAGMDVADLAQIFGVEQQTVRVVLRQRGAGRRARQQATSA